MPQLNQAVNEHDHIEGPETAPVTLVEYGDYECPDCGDAYPIVKAIQQRFGDRLRFVFREFPLRQHPHAQHASEAAEAAGAQGAFWEMHDMLFTHQQQLSDSDLLHMASHLPIDQERFRNDLTSHTFAQRVLADRQSGLEGGVEGTPSFYINGELYDASYDQQTLGSAIEKVIARA